MKYLGFIISIFLFASCHHSTQVEIKKGSQYVTNTIDTLTKGRTYNVWFLGGNGYVRALGKIVSFDDYLVITDSSKHETEWQQKPSWSLFVPDPTMKDTARDKNGKPRQDSITKRYLFNNVWYNLNQTEREAVKVEISHI